LARGGYCLARGGHCLARGGHCLARGSHCLARGSNCLARGGHCLTRGSHCLARGGYCLKKMVSPSQTLGVVAEKRVSVVKKTTTLTTKMTIQAKATSIVPQKIMAVGTKKDSPVLKMATAI